MYLNLIDNDLNEEGHSAAEVPYLGDGLQAGVLAHCFSASLQRLMARLRPLSSLCKHETSRKGQRQGRW